MNTVHINLASNIPETKRRQTVDFESDTQTTHAPSNDFLTLTQIVCPTQGAHIQCLIFRETNEQTNGADNQTELVSPYNAIRSGIPSHVRSKNELSNNDLSFITDKQLLIYKQKYIQKIISSFEGREDLALMVLRRMTQFGNIKSLEHLNNKLTEMLGENYVVYTDKGPALATNLMYLFRKSALTQEPQVVHLKNLDHIFSPDKNPDKTSRRPALLVDEYILERLKSNPQLVQKLQNAGAMLIIPESFDTGVSFCNQAISIQKRLTRLVNKVEQIQTKTGLNLDDCIDKALNRRIRKDLAELGFNSDQIQTLRIVEDNTSTTVKDITNQLNPIRVSGRQLGAALRDALPGKQGFLRRYARELIAQNAQMYSPRRISLIMRKQHQQILDIADERGIPHEKILYYIPEPTASYGLYTMIYRATNHIPSTQIVTSVSGANGIREVRGGNRMIVILDDISSSGTQPNTIYQALKGAKLRDNIGFFPLIASTGSSKTAVARFQALKKQDSNLHFLPHDTVTKFTESPYFHSLSPKQRERFLLLTQDDGFILNNYGGNGLCTLFPQMSPTSNNAFWNAIIAPLFLPSPNSVSIGRDSLKWQPIQSKEN